jgi:hypothetical protein
MVFFNGSAVLAIVGAIVGLSMGASNSIKGGRILAANAPTVVQNEFGPKPISNDISYQTTS